jgi:valine dehydrogenase (NAD+)
VGVFERTDHPGELAKEGGHEQVVFCHDRSSGLRAIIAVYSTALGPALGGTRFYPYADEAAALDDVLKLSRAMAYKAACAGIDLGGGKAVILGDPARDKSEALLRAYGRFVQTLGGRYYTAADVGTYVADMDVIAKETDFVTGRSVADGGAGDSGVLTAYGVFQSMRAAAEHAWGSPSLAGRRVAVEGVGKVGATSSSTCSPTAPGSWCPTSARPPWSGPGPAPRRRGAGRRGAAGRRRRRLLALRSGRVGHRRARAAAAGPDRVRRREQPAAAPGVEKALADRGVLYAPDYVANAGGLCQVADEAIGRGGFSVRAGAGQGTAIFDTTLAVLRLAEADGVPPAVAADRLAERRIADVGRVRSMLVPGRR